MHKPNLKHHDGKAQPESARFVGKVARTIVGASCSEQRPALARPGHGAVRRCLRASSFLFLSRRADVTAARAPGAVAIIAATSARRASRRGPGPREPCATCGWRMVNRIVPWEVDRLDKEKRFYIPDYIESFCPFREAVSRSRCPHGNAQFPGIGTFHNVLAMKRKSCVDDSPASELPPSVAAADPDLHYRAQRAHGTIMAALPPGPHETCLYVQDGAHAARAKTTLLAAPSLQCRLSLESASSASWADAVSLHRVPSSARSQ